MTLAHEVSASGGLRVQLEWSKGQVQKQQNHLGQSKGQNDHKTINQHSTSSAISTQNHQSSDVKSTQLSIQSSTRAICSSQTIPSHLHDDHSTLLATAKVKANSHSGSYIARVLIDPGSELTLITSQIANLLPSSTTIKLRVVFNGSSPTSTGISLNDITHTGTKIQLDIFDVLLWVRQYQYVFATDITKKYRQIMVHHEDWKLQQILWLDNHNKIIPFQLTTVTYGTRSAPYLAVRVLLQLVEDEGQKYPKATQTIIKGRYVDEIFGGADSPEELIQVAEELINLCKAGGFPLAKWQSNSQSLLQKTSQSSGNQQKITFEDCTTKILGLQWNPSSDTFTFTSKAVTHESTYSKRLILSEVAQIYDPLGFVSPITIRAKMLLQELWLHNLSWDEPVPQSIINRWLIIRDEFTQLHEISLPRWIHTTRHLTVEIHGFSDASQLAMAAAIYLKIHSIHLWTDSLITHSWINSNAGRWKDFVRNRVVQIQELVADAHWHHISGKENPADCASRGITANQLKDHSLWWRGPTWLAENQENWPVNSPPADEACNLEARPGISLIAAIQDTIIQWDLVNRYSTLNKLLRITALIIKFTSRLRHSSVTSPLASITTADIEKARIFWIKSTQAAHFHQEIRTLSNNQHLPPNHSFNRLTAYVDSEGVLQVGGRL
ncbi:uncharacterized protein [Chelonus insularis]|uniref:uncharacterized protein n=1 Tax=Chelonus insularis TaxID=460826 RepID=UPI00158B3AD1|nr:uncharacterized protein LOC118066579 [Chelonus insularis]